MASPYYTEPANILPGLQMLGEGLNRRAEMARKRAAAAEEAENMKLAEEALKSGDPDMVDQAMLKNPKLAPLIQQRMGIKKDQDLSKETDSILRILSETDPTAKTEIILEEATRAHEAGEPYKHFLDMGYMATSGKHADVDKKLSLMLAASNPEAYRAYKEQDGMGKDKNLSQIRYDYEKAKEEGYEGDFLKYVKDFKAAERAPEKPVVESLSQEGKLLKEQSRYPKGSKQWNYYQKRMDKLTKDTGKTSIQTYRSPTKTEQDLANMLANNEIDVSQLPKRGDSFNMIVSLAKQINPDLNVRELTGDFSLSKNAGFRQKAIVAGAVDDIITKIEQASKKVNFSNLKAIGSFQKFMKSQTNDPGFVEYMSLRNDGLMELAGVMRMSGMTDMAHKAEEEAAHPTMSPRAVEAWARAQREALKPRIERYNKVINPSQNKKQKSNVSRSQNKSDPLGIR